MTTSVWSNVAVAVQSALGPAITITAISKANPGVATATAHGLSDGDYILVLAQGMHQVNGRIFRVASSDANTFALEGEDTTDYDTFVSGTAQEITFGTSISTITGVTASGGDFEFDDDTTIHVSQRSQIPTVASPVTYSMESIWDPEDAAQIALKAASQAKEQRAVKFTFANGKISLFYGYVGFTGVPTGTAQAKVITPLVFTVSRPFTNYAS